jgi:hypothetical protein
MNTKEKNLSNTLKKYYLENKFLFDKIESRLTATGIPDLLVCSPNGVEQLVELKVVEKEGNKAHILHLTPGQVAWHAKRNLYHRSNPFVVLLEELDKLVIISSRKAVEIIREGGKVDYNSIPKECLFDRKKVDYSLLIFTTTDLFYSSQKVYK